MKFKSLENFINKLNKITKINWSIENLSGFDKETYLDNNSLSYWENCDLDEFDNLPQNVELSIEDFKYYLKINDKDLSFINLEQSLMLSYVDNKTQDTHIDYTISRKIPFNAKLDDGSLVINNLKNFKWKFEWRKGYLSGLHAVNSGAWIEISAEPTNQLLEYLSKRPLQKEEIIPLTHHRDEFNNLALLRDKVIGDVKKKPLTERIIDYVKNTM